MASRWLALYIAERNARPTVAVPGQHNNKLLRLMEWGRYYGGLDYNLTLIRVYMLHMLESLTHLKHD